MQQTQLKNAHIFEALASATPLKDVLSLITKLIEETRPGMLSSILLLNQKQNTLYEGAAPSLPKSYNSAVNGLPIGLGICSCGESAFTGKTVIVEDINSHPNWASKDKLNIAKKAGLKSCWSEPIFSSSNKVIGTLAMYHREIKQPTIEDLEILRSTAHMSGIAIERRLKEEAVFKSEKKFKTLFNALNDAVILMADGKFVDCNDKTLKTFKCKRDDIIGKSPNEFAPIAQPDGNLSEFEIFKKISLAKNGKPQIFESKRITKDGEVFDAEINLSSFEMDDQVYILGIVRDISLKLKNEKKILDSEIKYKQLTQASLDGLVVVNSNYNITLFNPAAERMFNYEAEKLIGKNINSLLINKNLSEFKNITTDFGKECVVYGIKSDGTQFPVETSFVEIKNGNEIYYSSFIRNVSHEKQNEINIFNALIEGQENERKRISKDLHDGLGQKLAAINLNLIAMRPFAENNECFQRINNITKDTIQEYRSIAHALMPPSLRDNSLSYAVKLMTTRLNQSSETKFIFIDLEKEIHFPENIKIELFRITQELINNAIKYANASEIIIKFQLNNDDFSLIVKDNGIGFNTSSITHDKSGIGISNIHARANFIKGLFKLESEENKGTKGVVTIKKLLKNI